MCQLLSSSLALDVHSQCSPFPQTPISFLNPSWYLHIDVKQDLKVHRSKTELLFSLSKPASPSAFQFVAISTILFPQANKLHSLLDSFASILTHVHSVRYYTFNCIQDLTICRQLQHFHLGLSLHYV